MKNIMTKLAMVAVALAAVIGVGAWVYAASAATTIDGTVFTPQDDAAKAKIAQDLKLAKALGENPAPHVEFGTLSGGANRQVAILGASSDQLVEKQVGETTYRYYLSSGESDTPTQVMTFALIARGAIGVLLLGAGLLFLVASFVGKNEDPEVALDA